jgi:hypothetical protein
VFQTLNVWHASARPDHAEKNVSGTGWTASAYGLEKFQAGSFGIASEGLGSAGSGGAPPFPAEMPPAGAAFFLRRRRRFLGRSGGVGATPTLASGLSTGATTMASTGA